MTRITHPKCVRSRPFTRSVCSLSMGVALFVPSLLLAQDAEDSEEIFELSPFTVDGSDDQGYRATSTLAGSRIRTDLKDVGAAVTVITKEFLEDLGAVDNETLLAYTPSMEVGGTYGNFSGASGDTSLNERDTFNNPNGNTRVRGLARADNTRNFFISDVPWDGYVVDRVDMARGPSAILFGLGSPAGVINATTQDASFNDEKKLEFRVGSYGSLRAVAKANVVLIEDQLAAKVAVVSDRQKFRQDPAHDDRERMYLAAKWKPNFLNGDGKRFSLKGNFEHGNVRSNRPRVLTPKDHITPFFNPVGRDEDGNYPEVPGVGKGVFDPALVRLGEFDELGLGGQLNKTLQIDGVDNVENPLWTPILGNYAQLFGGPLFVFDSADGGLSRAIITEPHFRGALGVNEDDEVVVDDTFDDYPYTRMTSIGGFGGYANAIKLPGYEYGLYKNYHLSDPTIFNFYDKLIDGPNKQEWSDWDALNLSLEQTFLNDKIGYEISYFDQQYSEGRVSVMVNDAIYVDTNSHLADGSVNPNAGRPFVSDAFQSGNRFATRDRDSYRVTGFAEYDFQDDNEGLVSRILGKHRINVVKSEENVYSDTRSFHRYRMDLPYIEYAGTDRWSDNAVQPNTTHYIGPALFDYDSGSGLNLSNLGAIQLPGSTADIRYFDTTWTADVDPASVWKVLPDGTEVYQTENWDNYVGWTTRSFGVVDALEGNNMDSMTGNATLSELTVQSEVAVWQGWFLDGSIVGMYGVREDKTSANVFGAPRIEPEDDYAAAGGPVGYVDLRPETYRFTEDPREDSRSSTSYSIVTHVDALPGMDWMPFNLSLSYNESENFQPAASRVDMFDAPLDVPTGETVDKGISISTKDGKYSLKVTDYETSSNLSNAGYIDGTWLVGRFVAWGENWKNVHKYNIDNGWTLDGVGENKGWRWNMKNPDGDFDQAFEDKAVADWENFVSAIKTEFPTYEEAWSIDDLGGEAKFRHSTDPAGLTYTQDAVAKGREYEFHARINESWNLTFNASQTKAFRKNVGGEAMIRWVEFVDKWFDETNAGDIRIWSGGGPSIKQTWQGSFRSNYALTELLEDTATSEMREWRFNAVTRYNFKDGGLKGLTLGGAVRWGDDPILGYPPITLEDGGLTYDLDDPFLGPDDTQFDFFTNYTKKLGNGTKWKIQLNVRNLFADDSLIPLSVQPDGTPNAFRIPADRTWSITNTFDF